MSDDLLHDLRELPPSSLDISPDFYERVMTTARRRQRVKRAGIAGVAASVVGAVVAVSVSLSSISSTARLDPVTPASPSAATATPAPSPTTSPEPSASPMTSPSAAPTSVSVLPPVPATTSAPVAVVSYPPLAYANLPSPCPNGYTGDTTAAGFVVVCIPPGYLPGPGASGCPEGSTLTQGPALCYTKQGAFVPFSGGPDVPPIASASLPPPTTCQGGYAQAGHSLCAPAAYVPRAGYSCPAGSVLGTDPGFCFTSAVRDTIVAPVPNS